VGRKYYRCGEKTQRELTIEDVVRLLERRLAAETDILRTAEDELAAAKQRCGGPQQGPPIVVAEPLGADEGMLLPLTDAGENTLHAMMQLTRHAEVSEHQDFETSLSCAHTYARRSATISGTISGLGVAVCTES
jgi:hypothetical protein